MENEAYRIELMKSKDKGSKGSYHLKTYYEKGTPILIREKKAQQLGVESVWMEYKYDQRAMVKGPSCSLKDMLYKAKRIDLESKFFTLKPQKYHRKLTSNSCEELMRVLVDFCEGMKAIKGRVINNKINTGNLYMVKNENWRLGEWGFASFRESHLIQGMEFENRLEPILKTEREWLVTPEYMAPEILRAISLGEDSDLIALGAASDIWYLLSDLGLLAWLSSRS